MTYSYSLTRTLDTGSGPGDDYSTTVSISDRDAVNCAHMVAAGFNTMSRNFMGDFVLAVVDTQAGAVQYDGKIERLSRGSTVTLTVFGGGGKGSAPSTGRVTYTQGPIFNDALSDDEVMAKASEALKKTAIGNLSRSVLEDAYLELEAVKEALADAGVETIPADAGVTDLRAMLRARDLEIAELRQTLVELAPARNEANEAARAELCKYVYGAYLKKKRLTLDAVRHDLEDRFRGMLDVLAKFLVVTGEADADEGHAVARRLCGVDDE